MALSLDAITLHLLLQERLPKSLHSHPKTFTAVWQEWSCGFYSGRGMFPKGTLLYRTLWKC